MFVVDYRSGFNKTIFGNVHVAGNHLDHSWVLHFRICQLSALLQHLLRPLLLLFSLSCSSLPAMMSTNIDAGQKIVSSPHHSTKQSTTNGSSQKESLSRTPIAPLAPLEYLQNQRRGSITDPSLHAATNSVGAKQNHTSQGFRQSEPGPGASTASQQNNASDPRPASPYVFGEASSRSSEGKGQIRNLLHSPSTEPSNNRDDSNETSSGPSKSSMVMDEGVFHLPLSLHLSLI